MFRDRERNDERRTGEIWEWKHLIESEASQVALVCTHSVDK